MTDDQDRKPGATALEAVSNARRLSRERGDGKIRVLFVCLGNICRSPAAEGVATSIAVERGVSDRFEFDSAGFYGGHAGSLPDLRMRRAASYRGYTLEHHSRTVKLSDYSYFDIILGMDDANIDDLHDHAPTLDDLRKIARMSDFATAFPSARSVPDPYYEGAEGFELVLDLLEDACSNLLTLLLK